ncbi:PTS system ascorbate-specific IIA component [Clostridium algifaecis]|uniref:Ascorbate-specific PTS system EIIA component n=1 Tax=Clostridium algifaecis TaxID=1472040 RepID=A0ABS4KRF2_9CLOT|nr:PTS sugar transporter subunit IIA [Clostridium algifaecis]MBP2032608.1 PTS system ascorbate-specific IIA component [Clostridium algifaecis]
MLSDLLNKDTIQIDNNAHMNWEDAIRKAAIPLLKNKSIEDKYVEAMINSVKENGPYINIGQDVAFAHSRPENGVNKIAVSLLKTYPAVNLVNENHKIKLWFVLSAVDNNSHLKVIQQLAELLGNEEKVNSMLSAESVDELVNIIDSNNKEER